MPCEPKPLGTCFFGDNPEPLRIHHLMRNCEIGHESTEIVAWVENFRASIDHGGRKKKFTIRFRASFVRLFANSRLSLSRSRSPSFKSLSRHSQLVHTYCASRDTIDRFGKWFKGQVSGVQGSETWSRISVTHKFYGVDSTHKSLICANKIGLSQQSFVKILQRNGSRFVACKTIVLHRIDEVVEAKRSADLQDPKSRSR